jgi:hypothetical protein
MWWLILQDMSAIYFQSGKYVSCESLVPKNEENNGSLLLGGKKFLDIYVGKKGIIPVIEVFETQHFGPVEFSLNIENEENTVLSKTIPFSSLLEEGKGVF